RHPREEGEYPARWRRWHGRRLLKPILQSVMPSNGGATDERLRFFWRAGQRLPQVSRAVQPADRMVS
ncbi:MAG: hypothetical protein RMN25_13045, partial [Anaerolineae bacterium]|nr:hypothetical protein [Thermoflexales bacterium]MDW8408699.1 hypothetical protein [Anaerolineae bacterium]